MNKTNFKGNSPQFWVSVLTFVFGLLALIGVELPGTPDMLANETVSVFTQTGFYGLIGAMGAAFFGIGISAYNKAKAGELHFSGLFGSVNLWLNVAVFFTSIAMFQGVAIDSDALPSLVTKVYAGDYFGAVAILITGLLNPLIRYIRDLRATATT